MNVTLSPENRQISYEKNMISFLILACVFILAGCGHTPSSGVEDRTVTESTTSSEGASGDYPAAIMVNDIIYKLVDEVPAEIDESAVLGYTTSYTDTMPSQNGETNFSRETGLPYVQCEDGIAVLYNNEWHLFTASDIEIFSD